MTGRELPDEIRSYATRENLHKALKLYGFDQDRYVEVYTKEGRVTVIFPQSNFREGGYVMKYSAKGFMTLG